MHAANELKTLGLSRTRWQTRAARSCLSPKDRRGMPIEEEVGILNPFQEAWKDDRPINWTHVALGPGKAKAFRYFERG